MNLFGFTLTHLELTLTGALLLFALFQMYFYIRYILAVYRLNKKRAKTTISNASTTPPVSVIICARDEAFKLQTTLPLFLEQEYPTFEVIVINDGSTDETAHLLDELSAQYPHLKTSFVPSDARMLSTRKLAISLGIKASKYDYILLTDATSSPNSKQWIASMMQHFTPTTEIVLGLRCFTEERSFINRVINFDALFSGMQSLGKAIARKPYAGNGHNLAFKKSTFIESKGFTEMLHIKGGDVELFINRVVNSKNVCVEASSDSILLATPHKQFKTWFMEKERCLHVMHYYTGKTKYRLLIEPLTRLFFYCLLALLIPYGSLLTWCSAAALFLLRFCLQTTAMSLSSKQYGGRYYIITTLFCDIYLPLLSIYFLTISNLYRKRSLRW